MEYIIVTFFFYYNLLPNTKYLADNTQKITIIDAHTFQELVTFWRLNSSAVLGHILRETKCE